MPAERGDKTKPSRDRVCQEELTIYGAVSAGDRWRERRLAETRGAIPKVAGIRNGVHTK